MELRWKRLDRKITASNPMPYLFHPINPVDVPARRMIAVKRQGARAAIAWCTEQFGPANGDRCWTHNGHFIFFGRDLEATAFVMRWC